LLIWINDEHPEKHSLSSEMIELGREISFNDEHPEKH
jgi:hypothetical protein